MLLDRARMSDVDRIAERVLPSGAGVHQKSGNVALIVGGGLWETCALAR
jgi:hypothetical protein